MKKYSFLQGSPCTWWHDLVWSDSIIDLVRSLVVKLQPCNHTDVITFFATEHARIVQE